MDDEAVREYQQKAMLLKQKRECCHVRSIDDLIQFLLNEKDIEDFLYKIEHHGDSVDSRILELANTVGPSRFTIPLMLKYLSQIKNCL